MQSALKCVVVGDGTVGKTCMLIRYAKNEFPLKYAPTIFDNYAVNVNIRGEEYTLGLYDTAGQEGYDRLRPLSYNKTDVFLVCFSVMLRSSFENVKEKWIPEIKHFCSKAQYVIVGTKVDCRNDPEELIKLHTQKQTPVTFEEGEKLAKKINAYSYVECSALNMTGIKNVFDEAILAALQPKSNKTSKCRFL